MAPAPRTSQPLIVVTVLLESDYRSHPNDTKHKNNKSLNQDYDGI
jgi:hypothetical protein